MMLQVKVSGGRQQRAAAKLRDDPAAGIGGFVMPDLVSLRKRRVLSVFRISAHCSVSMP